LAQALTPAGQAIYTSPSAPPVPSQSASFDSRWIGDSEECRCTEVSLKMVCRA
jgi:hypothetical protein